MKKWIIASLVLCFLLNVKVVYADDLEDEAKEVLDIKNAIETSINTKKELTINSRAAVIYDRTSGTIIWGKKQDEKRAMASTTKIMTCIIVLENSNLSDVVTVSKKAANTGGSRLKINTGDKITVNNLLYGLMLRSRK